MNRDELYFDVCLLVSTVCSPFLKILSWNFQCVFTWPCSLVFVAVSQKVRLNVAPMPKSVFCLFLCYFPSNWVEIACVMPGDPTYIDQVSDHWSSSKSKVTLMAMLHWTEGAKNADFSTSSELAENWRKSSLDFYQSCSLNAIVSLGKFKHRKKHRRKVSFNSWAKFKFSNSLSD